MSKITCFHYRLPSEKLGTFTITIAISKKWTFGHPCLIVLYSNLVVFVLSLQSIFPLSLHNVVVLLSLQNVSSLILHNVVVVLSLQNVSSLSLDNVAVVLSLHNLVVVSSA